MDCSNLPRLADALRALHVPYVLESFNGCAQLVRVNATRGTSFLLFTEEGRNLANGAALFAVGCYPDLDSTGETISAAVDEHGAAFIAQTFRADTDRGEAMAKSNPNASGREPFPIPSSGDARLLADMLRDAEREVEAQAKCLRADELEIGELRRALREIAASCATDCDPSGRPFEPDELREHVEAEARAALGAFEPDEEGSEEDTEELDTFGFR